MDEKIKIAKMTMYTEACPTQFEGRTSDGDWIYIRYRFGVLRVGVGATAYKARNNAFGDAFLVDLGNDNKIGDDLDGMITLDEVIALTEGKIDWDIVR